MGVRILIGDVFDRLAGLDDESVHCCVFSPPYWGLRDYGVAGQIGMEPTLGEHLDVMVRLMREVRRVLRPDGTVWLNYGDCYATQPNGRSATDTKAEGNDDRTFRDKPFSTVGPIYVPDHEGGDRRGHSDCKQNRNEGSNKTGRIVAGGVLKPKDLCLVPQRLAIALQEDGWWVRSEIIWHKPNPMPESVSDRPVSAHEKLYLLTKSDKYFYDAEAVREPAAQSTVERFCQDIDAQVGSARANGGVREERPMKAVGNGTTRHIRNVWTFATSPFRVEMCTSCGEIFLDETLGCIRTEDYVDANGKDRIRRVCPCGAHDAWLSHFATFPPALVEPCVKAGTSEQGVCPECGAPYARMVEKSHKNDSTADGRPAKGNHKAGNEDSTKTFASGERTRLHTRTIGWQPTCTCDAGPPVPALVLDPFGGAGTTGLVAQELGRDAVLIELNEDYAAIAHKRLHAAMPLFADVVREWGTPSGPVKTYSAVLKTCVREANSKKRAAG